MKTVGIGVLGLGTIGGELVRIIQENGQRVRELYDLDLQLKKIFVRDVNKKRGIDTTDLCLTDKAEEVIEDPEVQILCECIGGSGEEETYRLLKDAIGRGLHVVMSSKKVLANHGMELLKLAIEHKTVLCYDATVGGGIPIEKVVENSFYCHEIAKIYGILNGTSNFICTRMSKDHQTFRAALKEAQARGYAENDPTDDVDSFDALYKAEVLALFCLEKHFNLKEVTPRTIRTIRPVDFEVLEDEGYTIKPIVSMRNQKDTLKYIIGPAVVSLEENILSKIDANNNIIGVIGSRSGELSFTGQGAGAAPTASVMFDDVINTSLKRNNAVQYTGIRPFTKVEEDNRALYIHLLVNDRPGEIAEISKILSERNINIDKFLTRGKTHELYDAFLFISNENNIDRDELVKTMKKHDVKIVSVIPIIYGKN